MLPFGALKRALQNVWTLRFVDPQSPPWAFPGPPGASRKPPGPKTDQSKKPRNLKELIKQWSSVQLWPVQCETQQNKRDTDPGSHLQCGHVGVQKTSRNGLSSKMSPCNGQVGYSTGFFEKGFKISVCEVCTRQLFKAFSDTYHGYTRDKF